MRTRRVLFPVEHYIDSDDTADCALAGPQISNMLKSAEAVRAAVANASLSGDALAAAVKDAEQLSTHAPFCPTLRLHRALLQLRAGNAAGALTCCEPIVMDAPREGAPTLGSSSWRPWLAAQARYHAGDLPEAAAEVRALPVARACFA